MYDNMNLQNYVTTKKAELEKLENSAKQLFEQINQAKQFIEKATAENYAIMGATTELKKIIDDLQKPVENDLIAAPVMSLDK